MKLKELCKLIGNDTDICINDTNTYECLYCDTLYTTRNVKYNSLNECLSECENYDVAMIYNDFMENTHGGIMGYLAINIEKGD